MSKVKSPPRSKYDWDKIRDEYVSGNITLDALSEKYKIPRATIGNRSSRENWMTLRRERKKTGAIFNEGGSDKLEKLREISEVLTKKISDAVSDERQFNRYLISEKASDENGKPITVTSERCFDKLDIKALKEMTSTLKVLSECVKELYDIEGGQAGSEDETALGGENEITVRFIDADEYAD